MAPELFEEHGVYSFASDIWSMGVLIYELATGAPPFNGENFEEIARSIMRKQLTPIRGYSDEFNSLLRKMLQKNPAERITWPEISTHSWWAGVTFNTPQFPD